MNNENIAGRARTAIIVLGMHRSGTSATAGLLSNMGCDLPNNLMAPHDMNSKGFFESNTITLLNDAILASAGMTWFDLNCFPGSWYSSHKAPEFREQARAALNDEFGASGLFVLKDPRHCRLVPFWEDVFTEQGVQPVYICIHRNPIEVAASLQKWHGTELLYGQLLWLRHVLDVEITTRGKKRVFVSYDQILSDWREVVGRTSNNLDLVFPRSLATAARGVHKFLSGELRHFSSVSLTTRELGETSDWLMETWEVLNRWSKTGEDATGHATLDNVRDAMNAASATMVNLANNVLARYHESGHQSEQIAALSVSLTNNEETRERQSAQLNLVNAALADSEETRERQSAQLNLVNAALAELKHGGAMMAEEMRQTEHRPWRPLKWAIQRGVLKFVLLFGGLMPERFNLRLRRSLAKRKPRRHVYGWAASVAKANRLDVPVDPLVAPRVNEDRGSISNKLARNLRQRLSAVVHPLFKRRTQTLGRLRSKRAFYIALKAVSRNSTANKFEAKITKYDRLIAQAKEDRRNKKQLSQLDTPVLSGIWPPSITTDPNENVKVSVFIPVYNQIEYTLGCLRSLQNHKTIHRLEVIVVDDCSNDSTKNELNQIPWVRYICQTKNAGFIESCNAGARQARGEFVLFLNNDTEVLDGWLDELVGTFSAFPNAGLVGSKLLYPDGSLQEAGGIMWRDGSAWNYGRNQDPRRPEFCYARKVDYCSGASVMVPNALFTRLGGFDLHFAPAYCEDSDLAMRVREAGHDVVYQPLSKLVHFEGVTSGTDVGAGVKAYQVINTKKLFERWKDRLSLRPENAQDPYDAKDFGLTKRILVIDHITPEPDQDAGSVDCMEFMRTVQLLGYQVSFIPETNFADIDKYTAALQRIGIEALYHPYVKDVKSHLKEHGHRYDAIVVYRVGILKRCLSSIRTFAPQARLIYQTADLHHLRQQREAELFADSVGLRKAEATKTEELNLVLSSDCTIVHSTHEKNYLEELVPNTQVEVINWILEPKGTEVGFEQRKGIMFLGGYRHSPNVDAVHYFLDEIWPLVQKRLPEAIFYVVGSHMPEELLARATKNVIMTGYVEDLRKIMDNCRLSVVPLRFGAGTKGKLAMSLAYGLPAVTTSIGSEGMGLIDGDGVFQADDNQKFAERIISLHEDRNTWEKMSREAISYVKENLSPASGKETILRALGRPTVEPCYIKRE